MAVQFEQRLSDKVTTVALKLKPFDAAKYLATREAQDELVKEAVNTGHAGYIAAALSAVARARSMTDPSEKRTV